MGDNDKLIHKTSEDENQIQSNLTEIDNLKQMYLEKTNNAFSKIVTKIFPGAVDKALKKITKEAIELKWEESKQLRNIKQQYQTQLLTEICNVRLADAKIFGRNYILERLQNSVIDIARDLEYKKTETTEIINKECERIKTIKHPGEKKRAETSLDNTVDVLYFVFDEHLNRMKSILDEEIKKANPK
jgi:hypothetical protein